MPALPSPVIKITTCNAPCTGECGNRCYVAYAQNEYGPEGDCPLYCHVKIEEIANDEQALEYLLQRALEMLQPEQKVSFFYAGVRRPTPELLFSHRCDGFTGNKWLQDQGGRLRIFKGLLLRVGHGSQVEVCDLDGQVLAQGEPYTREEYYQKGGAAWVEQEAENLARKYLEKIAGNERE